MSEELEQFPKQASPWNTGMKWGVILFVLAAAMYYLTHMNTDFGSVESYEATQKNPIQYAGFLISLAILIVAQLEHRNKDLGGYMSFARAFGIGTIVFLTYGLLDSMLTYVEMSMIHPEVIETLQNIQMKNLQSGNFSAEEMEMAYERSKSFTTPTAISIVKFFGSLLLGVIFSLLTGLFTRKANPDEI
ncbi:MAG: DUF4199 domain-containing protein [Bacteroidetes bacterium]|nr:MAG: DUF4199 domain-containing protein [Bacteroidota bacterium]